MDRYPKVNAYYIPATIPLVSTQIIFGVEHD
jgi:hypothetical protein